LYVVLRAHANPNERLRWLLAGSQGEFYREGGTAASAFALDHHTSAVQLDQMPDDRESQAETTVTSSRSHVGLAKSIEDVGEKFRSDALTRVFHANFQGRART
jgi:hypothetical protein